MSRRSPEKDLQRQILTALRSLGFWAGDMSQPRRTMMPVGLPDIYAQHAGWKIRLWVEVKTPTGRLTHHQRAWHEHERAAGGTVIVARSVSDVVGAVQQLMQDRAA